MSTRLARLAAHAHRSERGQVLILFVAMFTVILALAAFAVDQTFWYGRRRIAQNAADTAARAGAIAYFGSTSAPCRLAATTAIQNAIDVSDPNGCDDGPTATHFDDDADAGQINNECVAAQIDMPVRSLFAGAFGIGDVDVGARATACAGTVDAIHVDADNDGPEGIAVVLGPGAGGNNRDCFTGSGSNRRLDVGRECVIWGALDDNNGQEHNRLLWDDEGDCDGNVSGSMGQISAGVAWTCAESIPGRDVEVDTDEINNVGGSNDQEDVLFAFRSRLQQSTDCYNGPDTASFLGAFARADGVDLEAVAPPPFSGSSSPRTNIYVQDECFNNPRIVVMPITFDSGTSGGDKDVDGFAFVYLTGCYDRGNNIQEPNNQAQTNTCSGSSLPNPTPQDASRECNDGPGYSPSSFCRIEIRGVPIRVFITDGAIGDLDDMDDSDGHNLPVTIQTFE